MGKINWNRVILGGLVAGVIINIFEFALHGFVLAKDMDAAVRALGREVGGGALLMFLAWGFLVGIFAVWLYAAIRPRYGAGAKTALCAGAAVWGLGYCLPRSARLRSIFSPDILWPSALRWGWWKSSSERWRAPGSTANRPPDPDSQKPRHETKIHYHPRSNP